MTAMLRLGVTLLLIAVALPFVAANCKEDEFWFEDKSCCLPYGGPPSPPDPPHGKRCPSNWGWRDEQGCCTPYDPDPSPPQCDEYWEWLDPDYYCKPKPQPSQSRKRAEAKRALEMSQIQLCPMGLTACPIADAHGLTNDLECLDTANELESCGGCSSTGQGTDCTAIEGAWNVGCEQGVCAVYTCAPGFRRSHHGANCIPLSNHVYRPY